MFNLDHRKRPAVVFLHLPNDEWSGTLAENKYHNDFFNFRPFTLFSPLFSSQLFDWFLMRPLIGSGNETTTVRSH